MSSGKEGGRWIYFAQSTATKLIKIGFTKDRERRLRTLQAMNGGDLIVLGFVPGGRRAEMEIHDRFDYLRHHGEWFKPGDDLLAFVNEVTAAVIPVSKRIKPNCSDASRSSSYYSANRVQVKGLSKLDSMLKKAIETTDDELIIGWLQNLFNSNEKIIRE